MWRDAKLCVGCRLTTQHERRYVKAGEYFCENARGKSAHIIRSKAAQEYGPINENLTAGMAFRDDSHGICEHLEFISCLKAYYVGLHRLKWNDVQVQEMVFMQQELAFVTNEVCLSWDLHSLRLQYHPDNNAGCKQCTSD
ncbi:hypothetical protein ABBQ38_011860 [Trebouxia sp. C0009 RCD-2024]